jgi:hypothetical protein
MILPLSEKKRKQLLNIEKYEKEKFTINFVLIYPSGI